MQALHGMLEAATGDCPADALARKLPGSTINSIGAIYAHTIFSEDGILIRSGMSCAGRTCGAHGALGRLLDADSLTAWRDFDGLSGANQFRPASVSLS